MYMQEFTPTPIAGNYQNPTDMYAHGGHVGHNRMHHQAQMLSHYGMGRDKILAHINPAEADYLQNHHGMSVNPYTGLPQFGLWDMVKSAGGALGNAALQAAPGLWAQYGQPMAQSALQNIDQRVQNALPGMAQNLGQKIGGQRFGQQLGQLGQSIGQNLSNQYGNYGGLAGQVIPRVNQAMGVQGPSQFPSVTSANPMQTAMNMGRNVYNDVGRGMVNQGLQSMDKSVMNRLPSSMASAYGQTPGIAGFAGPRIDRTVMGNQAPMSGYAHGGYVHHAQPYMAAGGHMYGGPMHYMMNDGGSHHSYPYGM